MKNNLFTKKILDSDTLLSAVYKAREKAGVLNSSTEQSVLGSTRNHGDFTSNETTLKSKIDRVEDRLKDAESKFTPTTTLVNYGKTEPGKKIILVEDRNTVDEGYEERKEQERAKEAFERILRNKLYGEPLAEKPVPLDRGVYSIGDAGSAPLRSGGPLAKNGARTRGYTDTGNGTGSAPIRFWAGTDEDRQRIQVEAVTRGVEANQEFHDYLVGAHIDIFNATPEQKEIIDMVGKEVMKKAVSDTLTEEDKARIFANTLEYLYKHTESANGDPYPVFIDIARSYDNSGGVFPEQKAMKDSSMSDADLKLVFEFGRQISSNGDQNEINDKRLEYKNQIFLEEMENYKAALQKGKAKVGDIQKYYDTALQRIYDTCIMPIPVKDSKGRAAGTVAIGDLIAPYDDSFGAEVARTAFQLLGLPYGDPAGKGNRPKIAIDCQGLVRWVLSEINPDWGDYGIGKGARYQIDDAVATWSIDDGDEIKSEDLQVGNTLFWQGDETGKIKHTAIYIGKFNEVDYMIEAAGGSVRIVPLRMHTSDPKGEDSTLCQINQMLPERLDENVTEYFQTNNG